MTLANRTTALPPALIGADIAQDILTQYEYEAFKAALFGITKYRAHQILQRAFERAGIQKPPHVGAVHVLRHSGALERLKETGNPQALQEQLGHTTAKMTLRYLKTLTAEEALRINQAVDFRW